MGSSVPGRIGMTSATQWSLPASCAGASGAARILERMTLVDTDVMIDIRRGHPPALAWFGGLEEVPGLPGFVLMELVAGCKTRKDMRELKKQAALFQIYWPTPVDCERALDTFMATRFRSGLSMPDAIIGATAVALSATLFT